MRRKRRKKRIVQIILMLFSLFTLVLVIALTYMEMNPMVAKALTVEAGTPSIEVKEILLDKYRNGRFITDIDKLDLNVPGVYKIQIEINNRVYTSNLEIVDTIAPKAEPVPLFVLKNEDIKANDFVTNVIDATDVNISFVSEPDTSVPGERDVEILLKDAGGNSLVLSSKLMVMDVKSSVQVEAGSVLDIKPMDFVEKDNIRVLILSDLSKLDISKPTVHTIQLEVDGIIFDSKIEVIDTSPPKASPVNKEVWLGDRLQAIDFVENLYDASPIKLSFVEVPDFESPGIQEVAIIIEDYYGNKTEVKSVLTVKEDTEAPIFSGIRDKTVYEGDSVSYKKGVSVSDNKDTDIDFQVDSSQVNLNKAGTYKVYYRAWDSSGNMAEETATITVLALSVTDDMLYEKVDEVLEKIINDNMTKREIAWEIYKWVKGNIAYIGSSDKSDWKKEAYRGIVNGQGDCFTYYAVSEAFLTRADIDNMLVTRVGGNTQHFWNLINCGDGWYHFDTCPNKDKLQTFMLTDAQVEEYTKKRGNNYYTFDKSLYPATPEN